MRSTGMECLSIRDRKIRRLIKKQRVRKQIRNSGMQNCIPLTLTDTNESMHIVLVLKIINEYSCAVSPHRNIQPYITAGICCGFFVLSPLRCKRHKNTLDGAKGYKNKSSPEVTTPKWNLWHQLCLLFKSILHDQAVSLSDCNGKFRSHHRSYEKYPCEQ